MGKRGKGGHGGDAKAMKKQDRIGGAIDKRALDHMEVDGTAQNIPSGKLSMKQKRVAKEAKRAAAKAAHRVSFF